MKHLVLGRREDETRHKGSSPRAHLWAKLIRSLHLIQKLMGGSQVFSREDYQFASEDDHLGEGVERSKTGDRETHEEQ